MLAIVNGHRHSANLPYLNKKFFYFFSSRPQNRKCFRYPRKQNLGIFAPCTVVYFSSSIFFLLKFRISNFQNLDATGRALRMQKLVLHNIQPSAAHPRAICCAIHLIDILKACIRGYGYAVTVLILSSRVGRGTML